MRSLSLFPSNLFCVSASWVVTKGTGLEPQFFSGKTNLQTGSKLTRLRHYEEHTDLWCLKGITHSVCTSDLSPHREPFTLTTHTPLLTDTPSPWTHRPGHGLVVLLRANILPFFPTPSLSHLFDISREMSHLAQLSRNPATQCRLLWPVSQVDSPQPWKLDPDVWDIKMLNPSPLPQPSPEHKRLVPHTATFS